MLVDRPLLTPFVAVPCVVVEIIELGCDDVRDSIVLLAVTAGLVADFPRPPRLEYATITPAAMITASNTETTTLLLELMALRLPAGSIRNISFEHQINHARLVVQVVEQRSSSVGCCQHGKSLGKLNPRFCF